MRRIYRPTWSMVFLFSALLFANASCVPHEIVKTTFCPRCNRIAGEGHVCGKTIRCPKCGYACKSLETHRCGETRYCSRCDRDVGPYHICGATTMCPKCGQEAGPGHVCGQTRMCVMCGHEVGGTHIHVPGSALPVEPDKK